MKKAFVWCLFAVAGASVFAAGTPGITGQWTVHNNIAGNESDLPCTFSQNDKELTGTCKTVSGPAKVTGTVDGKKLTWKYDTDYNGSTLTLSYTATLDDSGKMSGTVEVQPFGVTGEFTAAPSSAPDSPQK